MKQLELVTNTQLRWSHWDVIVQPTAQIFEGDILLVILGEPESEPRENSNLAQEVRNLGRSLSEECEDQEGENLKNLKVSNIAITMRKNSPKKPSIFKYFNFL